MFFPQGESLKTFQRHRKSADEKVQMAGDNFSHQL